MRTGVNVEEPQYGFHFRPIVNTGVFEDKIMVARSQSGPAVFMLLADELNQSCSINYQTNHANFNTTTFTGGFGYQVGFQKTSSYEYFYWTRISNISGQSGIKMVLNEFGNLGIGTINPSEKLTVQGNIRAIGDVNATGNLFAGPSYNGGFYSGDSNWGFKISNFSGQYWTEARGYWNTSGRGFRCVNVTSGVVSFVVNYNNCVGIGITNPTVRLQVENGGVNTGAVSTFFGNTTHDGRNGGLGDTVIFARGSIHSTNWFGSSSDIRIKKNIQDLDDTEMLNKVLLLKPVKYAYIDKEKNDELVYGFIAQDVREVMGNEGVKLMTEFIYDINKNAIINDGVITFNGLLEVGLIYKIFHKEKAEYLIIKIDGKTSENTYTSTLEIGGEIENSEIFIIGKRVDDFHSLNKNAIFTMGIGATQELNRIITRQQTIIDGLISRIEALENS